MCKIILKEGVQLTNAIALNLSCLHRFEKLAHKRLDYSFLALTKKIDMM